MSEQPSYEVLFAEARSMIWRVVEDWPYQPPEVVRAESEAMRHWLEVHPFDMRASLAALRAHADEEALS